MYRAWPYTNHNLLKYTPLRESCGFWCACCCLCPWAAHGGAVFAEGGDRLMINSVSIKLVHAALPGSDVLPGMVIRTGLFYYQGVLANN